jgi:hypothetical protein
VVLSAFHDVRTRATSRHHGHLASRGPAGWRVGVVLAGAQRPIASHEQPLRRAGPAATLVIAGRRELQGGRHGVHRHRRTRARVRRRGRRGTDTRRRDQLRRRGRAGAARPTRAPAHARRTPRGHSRKRTPRSDPALPHLSSPLGRPRAAARATRSAGPPPSARTGVAGRQSRWGVGCTRVLDPPFAERRRIAA